MPDLAQLETLAILLALPDDALLTTEEAAIVLRSSPRTLERGRAPGGDGPEFHQAGAKGAKGSNQKILYEKAALKAWLAARKVSSSVEAAVRKGQLSFATLPDLLEPAPFWISEGKIDGWAEGEDLEVFVAKLGQREADWIAPIEAARRPWSDLDALSRFSGRLASTLGDLAGEMRARAEEAELLILLPPPPPPRRTGGPL